MIQREFMKSGIRIFDSMTRLNKVLLVTLIAFIVAILAIASRPTVEDQARDQDIAARTAEDAATHARSRELAKRQQHSPTTAESRCLSLRHRAIGDLSANDLDQIQTCRVQGLWETK